MIRNNSKIQGVAPYVLAAVVLLAGMVLVACEQKKEGVRTMPTPEVTTVTISPEPVALITELPGRVVAFRTAEIRPQVNGLIVKRLFEEGSYIKEGQPLYQIDPAPFQAALDNARAALVRSRSQLPSIQARAERYKELLTDKAVSQQDYDDAAAALAQVKADIEYWKTAMETARINLDYCSITAPISGRIGRSSVTEGAIVTAYQPVALATIRQLDPIYVEVPQSRTAMLHLKQRLTSGALVRGGQTKRNVELVLEDNSIYPLKGTVQFSEVNVDETTGTVTMQIIFDNPEKLLLPGMFVRARIGEGVNPKAILIPQNAVARDHKGEPYVLTVTPENTVALNPVSLDRAIGNKWLVTSGLNPGDRVILTGRQFVRPGMTVRVASTPENTGTSVRQPVSATTAQGDK
ncbi:efflux RND transporter periplasmic adaptor subunit [Desulfoplanes formicivorans]|uniref:Hemolysin D n=1 Tax=Desulfoplanes formicivorans TaxID=1592317 RepID=A0A194AHZ8_9BACT|nr:efflux RND transporter periplasmic adaptor subunit [Desulfoplanes formicivorans]GAU08850.1 hemolysin D [Desulfoplanes formicivorans]